MATRCLSSMVLEKVPVNNMNYHSLPLTPIKAQAYPQSAPRQHGLFRARKPFTREITYLARKSVVYVMGKFFERLWTAVSRLGWPR